MLLRTPVMMSALFSLMLPLTSAISQEPPLVAPQEARTPEEEKKQFKLPQGFEVQLVASEPDIAKPMNLAFDHQGRLWVTSSLEYPFPAPPGQGRDMVHVLEDFAPEGKARKITTFAKNLNIPIGLLPRKDGALVYSINSLDHFRGKAGELYSKREKLYGGFGSRDTHGMVNSLTLGFDGWLYACHGYANDSTTAGKDGQELKMNSGNVFRMRPDGSRAEIFTRGQVNPFGMCFDPWGNLYTADCHTKPITQLLRGAYYDSFGKPHDGLGFGPNMMGHMHDSTGLCGLAYYAADAFPKNFRDTMFVGNVVTSRINHDKIIFKGSTPVAVPQPDFLVSTDPWFRPVYIVLGPDGALYVADFYNKIIGHYEVPLSHPGRDRTRGRIWRIVYKGEDVKPTPVPHNGDFTKADVQALVDDLDHPNLAVGMTALHELADRSSQVFDLLGPQQKVQSPYLLWVCRRSQPLWNVIRSACKSDDPLQAVHAFRIMAEQPNRQEEDRQILLANLSNPDRWLRRNPLVIRCAVEAVGTDPLGSKENLQTLISLRSRIDREDTHLIHALRIAQRNQLARLPEEDFQKLTALQIADLSDVCLGITDERGGQAALRFLQGNPAWSELIPRLYSHAARWVASELPVLRQIAATYQHDFSRRALLIQSLVQGLREANISIPLDVSKEAEDLATNLCSSSEARLVRIGLELCSHVRLKSQFDLVHGVAKKAAFSQELRTQAVSIMTQLDPNQAEPALLQFIADADLPIELRERATTQLAALNQPQSRARLLQVVNNVPSRLANVICYSLANTPAGAAELLDAVQKRKIPPSVLLTSSVQLRIFNHRRADFKERYDKLTEGLPPADARLADLVKQRAQTFRPEEARPDLGQKLFTQHCANCHQLSNQGSKAGPQLDGIGIRGVERLLEDVLDPNRNVDHAFRASVLVLKDGRTLTGLVTREEGNTLVLVDAQGKETKFILNDIEERKTSNLSPMPATFDTQLNELEMRHLLAYLLRQKAAPSQQK